MIGIGLISGLMVFDNSCYEGNLTYCFPEDSFTLINCRFGVASHSKVEFVRQPGSHDKTKLSRSTCIKLQALRELSRTLVSSGQKIRFGFLIEQLLGRSRISYQKKCVRKTEMPF